MLRGFFYVFYGPENELILYNDKTCSVNYSFEILSSISNEAWAVSASMASAIHSFLESGNDGQMMALVPPQAKSLEEVKAEAMALVKVEASMDGAAVQAEQTVAVIRFSGMLMIESYYYCGSGYLCQLLLNADQDPAVSAIVIDINSYGGAVTASEALADCVKALSKPVVGYINKAACSGGYWGIVNSDYIFVAGKTSLLGSLGTMTTIVQYKNSESYKVFELYASTSSKKNEAVRELAKSGKDTKIIARLDQLDAIFMEAVVAARGDVLDAKNTLEGQDYLSEDAIKYGLADAIGTLQDAVNKAAEMAGTGKIKKNIDMGLFGTDLPKDIKALAGLPVAEISDGLLEAANASLKVEKLEGLELVKTESVKALQEAAKTLQTTNTTLTTEVATKTTELTKVQGELADAQAEVKRLGAQAGAKPLDLLSTATSEAEAPVDEPTYTSEANQLMEKRQRELGVIK